MKMAIMVNRPMITRRQVLQTSSIGVAIGTAGCTGILSDDSPETEITYTDRDDGVVSEDDGYPARFNEWQEETVEDAEDRVLINGNLNDDRYEDTVSQVRAGEQPAEVIGVDIVRFGDFHLNFEMLSDMEDFVQGLDYRDDFLDGLDSFFEIDGDTVGVPTWIDCSVLHYNIEHFEEAGLDHPPETWNDFAEAAEVLSDDEFPAIGCMFTTGLNMFFLTPFMWANGGGWFDEDGGIAFDSEENAETLEFWMELQDQGYTTDLIGTEFEDYHNMFYNENLSMILSTPLTDVEENNSEMFENHYGTAVFPRPEDGEHSSFIGGNTTSIFSSVEGENREAAETFIEWLNTEDGMRTTQELGFLPARAEGYEIGHFAEEPYSTLYEASEEALEVGQTLTHPQTEALGNAFQPYLEDAFAGDLSAQEAVEQGAEAMRETLDED